MASWILVPCLVSLRNEFNELAPDRDKASDGSIGDASHAANSSDHNPDEAGNTPYEDADSRNEVHAIDVDDDLRKAGWTMTRALEIIITRHREGRDNRLQNVIYNRRIWSASWGWTARAYSGANAHTEHAHFSARYTTAQENDTSPWGLLKDEEDDMPSAEDVANAVIAKLREQGGKDVIYGGWNQDRIQAYNTDPGTLAQAARKATAGDNGLMTPASALAFAVKNGDFAKLLQLKTDDKVDALLTIVKAIAATINAEAVEDDGELAAVLAKVEEQTGRTVEGVMSGLGTGQSDAQAAEMLRAVYGRERAASIGDLLVAKA
ncbi:MAG: hypothetical protein ABW000_07300 [Actinoplanes sp.]